MIKLFANSGSSKHTLDGMNVVTVPVLGQHGTTNGADTCGFHSLKNALLCLHMAYHTDDNVVGNQTRENLQSVAFYENLYSKWKTYVPRCQSGFDASIAVLVCILDDYQNGKLSFSPIVDKLFESGWSRYITVSTLNLTSGEKYSPSLSFTQKWYF